MGAFDELKEWFSVKDAAAYVSEKIAERIEQKDLLELASEQRLVLHYNLTGQTAAVLPNHGKWALVSRSFLPTIQSQKRRKKMTSSMVNIA